MFSADIVTANFGENYAKTCTTYTKRDENLYYTYSTHPQSLTTSPFLPFRPRTVTENHNGSDKSPSL